jgi:hypothetical protein
MQQFMGRHETEAEVVCIQQFEVGARNGIFFIGIIVIGIFSICSHRNMIVVGMFERIIVGIQFLGMNPCFTTHSVSKKM